MLNVTRTKRRYIAAAGFILLAAATALLLYAWNRPEDVPASTYTNPVFEPVLADPAVLRGDDGYVYAYGTEDDWGDGEGSRIVPVIRSKDMTEWEYIGEAFEEKPAWKDGGVWAPDVVNYNGNYYMYYTMSVWGDQNPGIGLAIADSPAGPFVDQGKLFVSEDMNAYSIDAAFFLDEGTPYLFFGGITSGIFGVQLSEDGRSIVGDKFQISGVGYEAPYIIKRGGYYYFFGSAGACCEGADSTYRVGVARAESIKGPYLNKAGTDINYADGDTILGGYFPADETQPFVGPGHNSVIIDDNGDDWIVYHAVDAGYPKFGHGATRRPLMIDKLIWDEGWPSVEGAVPGTGEKEGPAFARGR
ncbi:family 43 glycosylhydrolase [Paenibacillus arenilitoris]|uniref:Family 43 glycosylhydrolase n=1 Tax=Paenibacillus arenilitoris TaxID=2772299 RepID=A0A927H4I2_9BACL|nr:family 43 glycosylhydrolase [Paenibacillus arenilitoris]MBD2867407.1 family 43 glycosylhydrolase [Paenibacillus arenilitoris]